MVTSLVTELRRNFPVLKTLLPANTSRLLTSAAIWLVAIWSLTILTVNSVHAQTNNFSTSLTSEYTFTASGSSTIKQNFSITNLTSEYLISNYEILFPGSLPSDLSGSDSKGKLTFQTEKNNSGTLLRVIFNSLAAGKNETLNFSLSFAGPKASRHDNVWEISIPPPTNIADISKYTLKLKIPPEMGLMAYSSLPASPSQPETSTRGTSYTFQDTLIETDGLSAVFGNFQTWGFRLKYLLENPTGQITTMKILLPSDNVGQKISFSALNPPPQNIEVADTGNWIGVYSLPPDQVVNIEVVGQVRLSTPLSPLSSIPDASIISFAAPGITPSKTLIRPNNAEIFYDIYSASFPKISLKLEMPNQLFPSLKSTAILKISNSGNTAAYWVPVSIQTQGFTADTQINNIPVIPPLSTYHQPVSISFGLGDLFSPKSAVIYAGNSFINYNIPTKLLTATYVITVLVISLCIFTAAEIAYKAGSVYIQKRFREGNLHRKSKKS